MSLLPNALKSIGQQSLAKYCRTIVVNDTAKNLNASSPILKSVNATVINTGGGAWTSKARNLALAKVETPLVTFLDADDTFTSRGLENLVRALAFYKNVGYVYGDVLVSKRGEKPSYVMTGDYDRATLRTQNLHAISILIPTQFARKVKFSEDLRGWEDWDYFIQLAKLGICGRRVPMPIITYDLSSGSNRVESYTKDATKAVRLKNKSFVEGESLMSCCGGNQPGIDAAMQIVAGLGPVEGGIRLEYTGERAASVTYNVNGRSYRAANNPLEKYIFTIPEDVEGLLRLGVFALAVPVADTEPFENVSDLADTNGGQPDVAPTDTKDPSGIVTPSGLEKLQAKAVTK